GPGGLRGGRAPRGLSPRSRRWPLAVVLSPLPGVPVPTFVASPPVARSVESTRVVPPRIESVVRSRRTRAMTTRIDVGDPPRSFRRWESFEVYFHSFPDYPTGRRGVYVESPEFRCFGHEWSVDVCPDGFGEGRRGSDPGMVAVHLSKRSPYCIVIDYALILKDSTNRRELSRHEKSSANFQDKCGYGVSNFAKRTSVMDSLAEGTLTIEVQMRRSESTKANQFVPSNPISKNILGMFMDEESSDIVFEVSPKNDTKSTKKAKPSPEKFYAHRIILEKAAPALAEMCENGESVTITDVKPHIFRRALYYAYGGKLRGDPWDHMEYVAKEMIEAADRFGMVNLKLEAEATYLNLIDLDAYSVMENLLYADAKNCALLKEAVIDYVLENDEYVLENASLKDMPGGMFADLLTAVARAKKENEDAENNEIKPSTMRVSELRKKLDEKDLEVDGSRESMIKTLNEYPDSESDESDTSTWRYFLGSCE
ncbi:hypothetical protein ACHAWF_013564, partial [Thalassiosira exigua]